MQGLTVSQLESFVVLLDSVQQAFSIASINFYKKIVYKKHEAEIRQKS